MSGVCSAGVVSLSGNKPSLAVNMVVIGSKALILLETSRRSMALRAKNAEPGDTADRKVWRPSERLTYGSASSMKTHLGYKVY